LRRSAEPSVDERDLQLIRFLEDDGRKPWRQIASEMGVSEATVSSGRGGRDKGLHCEGGAR